MGDLSRHFSRWEFECKCGCGANTVDHELINVLEEARADLGAPITVTPNGGCRCVGWNKICGGAEDSQHTYFRAADIVVTGIKPEKVQNYLINKYPHQYGIGKYNSFTHIDTKSGKARRW